MALDCQETTLRRCSLKGGNVLKEALVSSDGVLRSWIMHGISVYTRSCLCLLVWFRVTDGTRRSHQPPSRIRHGTTRPSSPLPHPQPIRHLHPRRHPRSPPSNPNPPSATVGLASTDRTVAVYATIFHGEDGEHSTCVHLTTLQLIPKTRGFGVDHQSGVGCAPNACILLATLTRFDNVLGEEEGSF